MDISIPSSVPRSHLHLPRASASALFAKKDSGSKRAKKGSAQVAEVVVAATVSPSPAATPAAEVQVDAAAVPPTLPPTPPIESAPTSMASAEVAVPPVQPASVFSTGDMKVSAPSMMILGKDSGDFDEDEGLPDRAKFAAFYNKVVKAGKEMRLDQFMRYDEVATMLDEEEVFPDDINDLWVSAVGDAAGLDESEAYEMLCMVGSLPEPVDEAFLDAEFEKLTGGKPSLKFPAFLGWEDVQGIIEEEALTMEQITALWRSVAGDLNSVVDRVGFGKLNMAIDTALDAAEEAELDDSDDDDEGDELDLTGVDIWSPSFDPREAFDDESLEEVTAFFNKAAGLKGIKFDDLVNWSDIQEMLNEKLVTMPQLQTIWREGSKGRSAIDLDTFIRFALKLDLILEEAEAANPSGKASSADSADNAEDFYRTEFRKLSGGGRLLRLDMLLGWGEVTELMDEGVLSAKQVKKMFDALPQEPMGIPSDRFGITEDTFVAFNGMLDMLMDASGSGDSGVAPTPLSLVSSAPRPMPSVKELTIGSLGSTAETDDMSTGLSQSELDIMETLDKADNMLNSGSFSDFDKLIGDINDPRLAALREKDTSAASITGSLQELLRDLLAITREQKRCGIDKPSEEDAARIRDLISAVIEQAPRAASKSIPELYAAVNGKWKMLYTNSEMFEFYNGVTGFVNVVCFTLICVVFSRFCI